MFLLEDSLSVRHMLRPFLKLFLLKAGAGIAFVLCLALNLAVSLTLQVHAQTQVLSSGPAGQVVKTPQVKATLFALAPDGIGPGKTLWLGLELVHQAHWHTYWRNPGDSGLPTELQWKLPTGMAAGPIVWPAPRRIPIGSLANYGYEDTTLLVTPIQIGPSFKPQNNESTIQIDLRANWLVCKQECIPQEGDFSLKLPVQGATSMARDAFEKALQLQAQALPGQHQARIAADGRTLKLSLSQLPPELQKGDWTVFPQTANVVKNSAAPIIQSMAPDASNKASAGTEVIVQISAERMDSPSQMTWLLVQGKADAPTGRQWTLTTPVQGQWQEFSEPVAPSNINFSALPNKSGAASTPAPFATWALAMLGAMLGGLLLNLMPCVFPVLAIKLLNITQHASHPREMKLSAWAFSAGVLISFLVLGALMLGLREAGSQLGWGFQLQSPWVVGALALLFAALGLNLSGLFEFRSFVPSNLAGLQWANPITNSLWSGVFAVVIASPCTAPFMGASLGLAIGLPAWQALPVFLAMGFGMALPFMAITLSTGWVKLLPRPGAWMQTFRQFMAFPMYATVVWLVWVLGQQVGLDGAIGFLACLLSLTLLIWALSLHGPGARAITVLALLVGALSIWQWGPTWALVETPPLNQSSASTSSSSSASSTSANQKVVWEEWSADKVAAARKEGRPVFVDFTAAWCVTCQFNKKSTFSDAGLLAEFASRNVLLLRADWTRYDPRITAALNELGRNGLPVYAWYAPDQPASLLSELITVKEIQSYLSQLKSPPIKQ
ncbi:protein-disulfide reductase DsbD [Limnohabitans sp. MMS-10A-178]|uniref:protein-disulfide reductase DsbD family protein n=1 Tax=Limnohabitans sp. MMS-10A-178 TaxID=1835767 RepID=UPI001E322C79|nr:thioredoxin family protein [Limnohabitans sp. MMS-10A-178]